MAKQQKSRTIRDVRGSELPSRFGIDPDEVFNITIMPAGSVQTDASKEKFMALLEKIWAHPATNPAFTQDDLYDEHGLPT